MGKLFKVGDKVRCISPQAYDSRGFPVPVGYEGAVTHVEDGYISVDSKLGVDGGAVFSPDAFELIKEPEVKKNIKPEDEVTLEVKTTYRDLASAYAVLGRTNGKDNHAIYLHIKNMIDADGSAHKLIDSHLKCIEYYSIQGEVESLLFPQETEQQKQIRELKETIEKAQRQIEELQKSS